MIEVYHAYKSFNNNKGLLQTSHGLDILGVVACDILDEMNQLNQQKLNQIITNAFLTHVIVTLRQQNLIKFTNVDDFKCFLAFIYNISSRNLDSEILREIITQQMVQNYLEGNIELPNFETEDNVIQNDLLKDGGESQANTNQNEQYEVNEETKQQDDDILNDQNEGLIVSYENDTDEQKRLYFETLELESQNAPFPLRDVKNLFQKYEYLELVSTCKPIDGKQQYQHCYKCKGMELPKVYSVIKSTKAEAEASAARKLYPHIMFYDRYQHPYERKVYKNKSGDSHDFTDMDLEEFKKKLLEDVLILSQCYPEIVSEVYEIISRQDKSTIQISLREFTGKSLNNVGYHTLVLYSGPNKVFEESAFGVKKDDAKKVAFFKFQLSLKKYLYEKTGQYSELFEAPREKKEYRRRRRGDQEENNE